MVFFFFFFSFKNKTTERSSNRKRGELAFCVSVWFINGLSMKTFAIFNSKMTQLENVPLIHCTMFIGSLHCHHALINPFHKQLYCTHWFTIEMSPKTWMFISFRFKGNSLLLLDDADDLKKKQPKYIAHLFCANRGLLFCFSLNNLPSFFFSFRFKPIEMSESLFRIFTRVSCSVEILCCYL